MSDRWHTQDKIERVSELEAQLLQASAAHAAAEATADDLRHQLLVADAAHAADTRSLREQLSSLQTGMVRTATPSAGTARGSTRSRHTLGWVCVLLA